MDKKIPLFFALKDYINKKRPAFHMPGHHRGKGIYKLLKDEWGENIFLYDITEVEGLDYLHKPEGVIKEAQELAAKAFGSDYTFFLINGSTVGNLVMLSSTLKSKDKVILQRNSHRSVIGGLAIFDLEPIYIQSEIHKYSGIPSGIKPEDYEDKLKNNSVKVSLITSPNYFGMCENIEEILKIGRKYDQTMLLDEAHGVHFPFNSKLPLTGIKIGYDMIVQSAHKTLPALTQTSFLHIKGNRVDMDKVFDALTYLESSSPSYLFMVSLDVARYQMESEGEKIWNEIIDLSNYLREEVNKIDGFYCFGKEILNAEVYDLDLTKIAINTKKIGLTGFEVEEILNKNYNIEIELSDSYNILIFLTPGITKEEIDKLIITLKDISIKYKKRPIEEEVIIPEIPKMAVTPKEAYINEKEIIELKDAKGRISGKVISAYPPGLPIIVPGEEISENILNYIYYLKEKKANLQGFIDVECNYIKVLK
ncbi:MAG TPA: aminotransferase class V-fold PLP-dependent enzyme [Caldisericia bacterium]|nr:aminotransferase class V-fold PLP-dependent enzyme [Caldisericia bacterium]HQN49068.1 aminotransferase class V-fold PLP-dependent enzyme [Caldisericia bacterium]HQP00236.1 aminotransferase class V-fold PLP-dependent enzyme [Caldisericia bacterium]